MSTNRLIMAALAGAFFAAPAIAAEPDHAATSTPAIKQAMHEQWNQLTPE